MTKKEFKEALLNNQVRNYDGELIPATVLTENKNVPESYVVDRLWNLYESDDVYVER